MLGYLRLLLSFGVVMAHCAATTDGVSRTMVGCFFLISGYLMMLTLDRNYGHSPLPFYKNRFLRLYPLFWLSCLLIAVIAPEMIIDRDGAGTWGCVTGLLLFSVHARWINGPAWTLCYEIGYYALAPWLKRIGMAGPLLLLAVGYTGFSMCQPAMNLLQPFATTFANVDTIYIEAIFSAAVLFSLGGVAFFLQRRLPTLQAKTSAMVRTIIIILFAVLLAVSGRFAIGKAAFAMFDQNWSQVFYSAAVTGTIIFLILWPRRESKASQLAGDLSYPLYILHYFVLNGILAKSEALRAFYGNLSHQAEAYAIAGVDVFLAAILTTALTLMLALGWVKIERRYLRRRHTAHPH